MTDRPAAAPHRTIHMFGNSHLDLVWLWPWQEAYREARATFASALDRMDEHPDFVFTCDQVVLLAWVEEQDPALFARIVERAAEGRWVNAGGWWVEPDCNLPTGESLVRQGLVGQRWLRSRFGKHADVGMNVDPFGHAGTIPQILAGQRLDSYCFLRPMAHEMDLPANLFRWVAPDGTGVTAYRIPYEYQTAWTSVDRHVEKAIAELPPGDEDLMVFFGVGDHGGGPTKAEIETVHRFDALGSFGALELSTPRRYFDAVRDRALPEVTGDLQHHSPGCYSAHSGIKIWMRRAQSALLVAERWAAVLETETGVDAPRAALAEAWRAVLENQFHDVLPGTAIEAGFDDARDQLGGATAAAKRITARAHAVLAGRIDLPLDPATQPVVVFNPHPWPVRADVELHLGVGGEVDPDRVTTEAGERVPSQPIASRSQVGRSVGAAVAFAADLPPLGHAVYRLHRSRSRSGGGAGTVVRGPLHLENDRLRVELDPATGDLAVLLHKASGIDLLAGAAGPHVQISADGSDTWGHRVVSYAGPGEPMRLERIVPREDGALRGVLRVERSWGASRLVEEVVLGRDADHVEVRVVLDWRERAHLMKLRWPVALEDPAAITQIPFGVQARPVDGGEQPGQSFVDLTGSIGGRRAGLAVLNDAKHGYDFSPAGGGRSPSIGITAVRSPVHAWHDPTPLDPDRVYSYQDQGEQRWTLRLVPHDGDPDVPDLHRRAAELDVRPRAMLEGFHGGDVPAVRSFADQGDGPVLVTAVKPAEDGDGVVVRALETSGRGASARIRVGSREIVAALPAAALRTWHLPSDAAEPIRPVDLLELPEEAP
ncbi:alpha-mannosidase [Amnibacterium endophyticum]|uniref:Alpha-mannosidase n=1 Tax=Amnibacterium endophyticum TaxID=2109337 RepID=A0ABW4LJF5_9MICO